MRYGGFLLNAEEFLRLASLISGKKQDCLAKAVYPVWTYTHTHYNICPRIVRFPDYECLDEAAAKILIPTRWRRFTYREFRRQGRDHSKLKQFKWGPKEDYALQIMESYGITHEGFVTVFVDDS